MSDPDKGSFSMNVPMMAAFLGLKLFGRGVMAMRLIPDSETEIAMIGPVRLCYSAPPAPFDADAVDADAAVPEGYCRVYVAALGGIHSATWEKVDLAGAHDQCLIHEADRKRLTWWRLYRATRNVVLQIPDDGPCYLEPSLPEIVASLLLPRDSG